MIWPNMRTAATHLLAPPPRAHVRVVVRAVLPGVRARRSRREVSIPVALLLRLCFHVKAVAPVRGYNAAAHRSW